MAELPIRPGQGVVITEDVITIAYVRATGPGGQNVNKVASAVHLRCDTMLLTMPDDMRARLATLSGSRMTKDGVIVLFADRFRTQERNRDDALERLADLFRRAAYRAPKRIATRPTRAAKERRLESKERRSGVKAGRGRFRGDD